MLHGIHPGLSRGQHRPRPVGVRHHRHALLMGNVNQLPDFFRFQPRLRQHAEPVKIHQAGNHNFDEIRPVFPGVHDYFREFFQILVLFADEAAVVPRLAQRSQRRPVGDAVLPCQLPGPFAHAPAVAAVPEIGKTQIIIPGKGLPNPLLIGLLPMPGNGRLPVFSVEHHVDVAVSVHFSLSFAKCPPEMGGQSCYCAFSASNRGLIFCR